MAVLEFISRPYIAAETVGSEGAFYSGAPVDELYYLCIGTRSKFALEIIKGEELVKPFYNKKHFCVIGIAGRRAGAFEITRHIFEKFILSGQRFETLKDYLQDFLENTYVD